MAGILLFTAGLLVGLRINHPVPGARATEVRPLSEFEGGLVAAQATRPALPPDQMPLDNTVPGSAGQSTATATAGVERTTDTQTAATPARPPERSSPLVAFQSTSLPAPSSTQDAPAEDSTATRRPTANADHSQTRSATREQPPTATLASAPRHEGHFVQVGVFGVAENAKAQLAIVLSEGFEGYIEPIRTRSGNTLDAVRFGNYASSEAAIDRAEQYKRAAPGREAIVGKVNQ